MDDIIESARRNAASISGATQESIDAAGQQAQIKIQRLQSQQTAQYGVQLKAAGSFIDQLKEKGEVVPTTIPELIQIAQADGRTDIATSLKNMPADNIYAYSALERKLAVAAAGGKDDNYGVDAANNFISVLSNRNSSAADIYHRMGHTKDSELTGIGGHALEQELEFSQKDAGARSFMDAEVAFLKKIQRDHIAPSWAPLKPGDSAALVTEFNKKLPILIQAIQSGRQQGKDVAHLFLPTLSNGNPNPDYVGRLIDSPEFKKIIPAVINKNLNTPTNPGNTSKSPFDGVKTIDDLNKMKGTMKHTPENEKALREFIHKKGWDKE
jgi:hypothetical protein